MKGKKIFK